MFEKSTTNSYRVAEYVARNCSNVPKALFQEEIRTHGYKSISRNSEVETKQA